MARSRLDIRLGIQFHIGTCCLINNISHWRCINWSNGGEKRCYFATYISPSATIARFFNRLALRNHRLFRQGLETGHVNHTFYGRRVCAVNVIMDSTFWVWRENIL